MTTTETTFSTSTITSTTSTTTGSPTASNAPNNTNLTSAGAIVGFVFLALYILFQTTVIILILCNKLRARRNRKRQASKPLATHSEYANLGSDVELGSISKNRLSSSEEGRIPQLPTNDEGGEDLDGKPKLQLEGTPVYQLDASENYETWTGRISMSNLREDIRHGEGPTSSPPAVPDRESEIAELDGSREARPVSQVVIEIDARNGVRRSESVVERRGTVVIDGVRVPLVLPPTKLERLSAPYKELAEDQMQSTTIGMGAFARTKNLVPIHRRAVKRRFGW